MKLLILLLILCLNCGATDVDYPIGLQYENIEGCWKTTDTLYKNLGSNLNYREIRIKKIQFTRFNYPIKITYNEAPYHLIDSISVLRKDSILNSHVIKKTGYVTQCNDIDSDTTKITVEYLLYSGETLDIYPYTKDIWIINEKEYRKIPPHQF